MEKGEIRSDLHTLIDVKVRPALSLDVEPPTQFALQARGDEVLEELIHVQHERRRGGVAVLVLQGAVGQDQPGQPQRGPVVLVEPGVLDAIETIQRHRRCRFGHAVECRQQPAKPPPIVVRNVRHT